MGVSGPDGPVPSHRALFVDRDGTLNPDLRYLKDAERLELFEGVGEALRAARARGWEIVCVTNQSGVERGFYTEDDVTRIHARVNALLAPSGARVDAFYHCPHAPARRCACRKPGTELFERAAVERSIDLGASAMIGDRAIDALAGRRLGMLTALVRRAGHAAEVDAEFAAAGIVPDLVAESFRGAVYRVLARG
jgi:D-glycero-D-manno-heptose 1,7-bisphosphate phosphatase